MSDEIQVTLENEIEAAISPEDITPVTLESVGFDTTTRIYFDYFELTEIIEGIYDLPEDSLLLIDGVGNDTYHTFYVRVGDDMFYKYDIEEINAVIEDKSQKNINKVDGREFLIDACTFGFIPAGEYLVFVSW